MNTKIFRRTMLLLILAASVLPACSQERKGPTIVYGKFEIDGRPVVNADISLVMTTKGSDGERWTTQTDSEGAFSFSNVVPGSYYISAQPSQPLPGALICTPLSGHFRIGISVMPQALLEGDWRSESDNERDALLLALQSPLATEIELESQPFKVRSGDQINMNISLQCVER